MTRSELNQILSWLDAGKLQIRLGREWVDYVIGKHADIWYPSDQFDLYRQKHTPTLRPWRPEEVPVGALLRRRFKPNNIVVILAANTVGTFPSVIVDRQNFDGITALYLGDLLSYHGGHNGDAMEHSLDHGKTWLPCGVTE